MINFTPNCTFPTASLGFVQTPPIRGTMEIVWSCVSVIFLCSWSILHLKVPPQHRPQDWRQRARWRFALFRRKLKWMVLTILAPEILLGFVFTEFLAARLFTPKMQAFAEEDQVPWSETHTRFANQGGFLLYFPPGLRGSADVGGGGGGGSAGDAGPRIDGADGADGAAIELMERGGRRTEEEEARTQVVELGDVARSPRFNSRRKKYVRRRERAIRHYGPLPGAPFEDFRKLVAEQAVPEYQDEVDHFLDACLSHLADTWVVEARQLRFFRKRGIIAMLPRLQPEELEDRNKGDAVVKLIAIIQVCWMGTQLLTRVARGLPVTTLEISTVAFVTSSLVIYLLQLSSIQDPAVPVRLVATRLPTSDEFGSHLEKMSHEFTGRIVTNGPAIGNGVVQSWSSRDSHRQYFYTLAGVGGLVFGGVHLAAWDFAFPTFTERTLWRASALVTVATPVVDALGFWVDSFFFPNSSTMFGLLGISNYLLLGPIYVAARLFLLVESFRSLYFLPPAAYQTTWTKNAPHFG
ncbi:hypothetical protein MAPG_08631 [Magnaporthiopsis poae ATCC 64411]|uniref:Uncharacterized protein n=1 Tax=Magnaporthiopsis poae (strain ATCC 64411 / 73-15) TaxID=644358 RepID=A0A0C4E7V6_MAGP6|nr:hypothetical protein MAPG_08631 [Magnaporthiopsis poae ATCC 64411]